MNAIANIKHTRPRRLALFASALLAAALGLSSAQAGNAEQPPLKVPHQPRRQHHWYQIGKASWYGKLFQGHKTASGQTYNMDDMTCAHRSLPIGSLVKVTNLRNNKSVIVRVNDRGPIARNRVVDLSYAAARFLGFAKRGTAPVRLDLIPTTPQLAHLAYPVAAR